MSTTINDLVDRRWGAHSAEELENVLNRARSILADTTALLDLEVERLFESNLEEADTRRLKTLQAMILQTQKGMQQIIDIEKKAGLRDTGTGSELDLEKAREEILRRIARLIT